MQRQSGQVGIGNHVMLNSSGRQKRPPGHLPGMSWCNLSLTGRACHNAFSTPPRPLTDQAASLVQTQSLRGERPWKAWMGEKEWKATYKEHCGESNSQPAKPRGFL